MEDLNLNNLAVRKADPVPAQPSKAIQLNSITPSK